MAAKDEDFETGETVQVSNCTFIGGSTDDEVVVKFDNSPFEYCLPGSAIRRQQPPPQTGSSGEGLKVENSHTFDRMLVCCHCNKSAEEVGILSNCAAHIPPAQAEPVEAVEKPRRRIEFTLKVGADSIKDFQQSLNQIAFDIEAGSRGPCVSGGVTAGWCWEIKEAESITHEMYVEQLQQYLAQNKEAS